MTTIAKNVAEMVDLLPPAKQIDAYNCIKALVLAWDPDFVKITPAEARLIEEAEDSGFVDEEDIDWNNLGKYA